MSKEQKQPYFRFFASDWLADTRGMNAAEAGVYITLIALMYERCEPLSPGDRRLARQCGAAPRAFAAILEQLIDDGKILRTAKGLWNERVEREFGWRAKKSQEAQEASNARWKKVRENNDSPMRAECGRNAKPEAKSQAIDPSGSIDIQAPPTCSPREELAKVLDIERASAVVEHRLKIKKPLTLHAARLLAGKFARCADPDTAADEMIANGWQGFDPEWLKNRSERDSGRSGPANAIQDAIKRVILKAREAERL